jgi:signal transduction histidine kinase
LSTGPRALAYVTASGRARGGAAKPVLAFSHGEPAIWSVVESSSAAGTAGHVRARWHRLCFLWSWIGGQVDNSPHRRISDFVLRHRDAVIEGWLAEVRAQLPSEAELSRSQTLNDLQHYLDELVHALRCDRDDRKVDEVARRHGAQRHELRRPIGDVVREYGILHRVIVRTAATLGEAFTPECVETLTSALFAGAAESTAQYARQRDVERDHAEAKHFAFFAHELRNPLSSVLMAWKILNLNQPTGRAAATLERNLHRLVHLIDDNLVQARLRAASGPLELVRERIDCQQLLEEIEADARPHAEARELVIGVDCQAGDLHADRRLLFSALSNIVRNAVKFTRSPGHIAIRCFGEGGRTIFEIQDECGGLPEGAEERLFDAFRQESPERSGFGLGLAIARHAVEAQGGTVSVTNLPGSGCVFRVAV